MVAGGETFRPARSLQSDSVCLLGPLPTEDLKRFQAHQTNMTRLGGTPWSLLNLPAALAYRQGRPEEAEKLLKQLLASQGSRARPVEWFLLALVQQRLGGREAADSFARGTELLAQRNTDDPTDDLSFPSPFGRASGWQARLACELLRREAELSLKQAPVPNQ
jgi:hypothetical protein